MKAIEAYEAVDGTIFTHKHTAEQHDLDCIGELFDALLLNAVQATGGNVTRNDQYRMCMQLLNDRDNLKGTINKLSDYLENI